ncbi:hypothetical protein GBA52_028595 [Prunus armeniaca]|nr:hypothetical protein GBA52_028595 [Prunus armeniaca]
MGFLSCAGHTLLTSSLIENYICDVWNVGLKFNKNESGIITQGEIMNKLDQLLGDVGFKARASKLKELAMTSVKEGGQSTRPSRILLNG